MKHILTIFILTIPFSLFANRADSLKNIVRTYETGTHFESDTNYINALIDVHEALKTVNADSSLFFGNKAFELSIRHEHHGGTIKAGFSMASIYAARIDKQNLINVANGILPAAEKTNKKLIAPAYNILGVAYLCDGAERTSLYQAKEIFQKVLEICREYNDTVTQIKALSNLYFAEVELFEYISATEHLYQAMGLAERIGMESGMPTMYHNMADLHYKQKNYDKAIVELNKGIELAEKSNNYMSMIMGFRLLALIYMGQEKFDEALDYINRSIELAQQFNLEGRVMQAKHTMLPIYIHKGLFDEALELAHELMASLEKGGKNEDAIHVKVNIAEIYLAKKQYNQTLKTCNEILETGMVNLGRLITVHQTMSRAYEAQNQGMKALEHYKQYKIFSDSLFHNNFDEQIINLEAQNKYEKKEMELKAGQALKETEYIKDKARLRLIIAFTLVLLFSMLVFLIFIMQSRRKLKSAYSSLEDANREIKIQKEEISMQSEELRTINEHLVQLIKFKQDISSMIVHDLKNPLSIMLGLTTSVPDGERLAMLHDSAQRMLNLVLNILDINKYEDSKLELKYSRTDINDLIKSVTKDVGTTLNFKQLNINLNLHNGLTFLFDKDIIRRVLDNILNNAIKFSPANETIHISSIRNGKNVRITVRNIGEPIPAGMQEAIFEPYGRIDRKENESPVKSTGLGLTFCKMAVMAHNGTIGVESSQDNPTDFWFEIPEEVKN